MEFETTQVFTVSRVFRRFMRIGAAGVPVPFIVMLYQGSFRKPFEILYETSPIAVLLGAVLMLGTVLAYTWMIFAMTNETVTLHKDRIVRRVPGIITTMIQWQDVTELKVNQGVLCIKAGAKSINLAPDKYQKGNLLKEKIAMLSRRKWKES